MTNMHAHRVYEFGPFRLHAAELTLLRDGKRVLLNHKAAQTLIALIEGQGAVVSKDELLNRVWPDTSVEEGILSRNICEIRKALGDSKDNFILTVPKLGYRFIHRVSAHDDDGCPKQPVSVAVLPFRVIGDDQNQRFLGLALADAVIARLGAIRNMVVRPTSAVSRYTDAPASAEEAARQLSVGAVLEGTIRLQAQQVRVIVHLVSAKDNAPMWSNTFDCRFSDLFELEDRIAVELASALVLRLTGTERENISRPSTRNAEAYRLYLKARYYFANIDSNDINAPLRYLYDALKLDPNFAECYASIAAWYTALTIHGAANPNEMVPKAKDAALKALRLNRHQQQARAALAFAVWHYDFEWAEAENELRRMVSNAPNDPFPKHLLAMLLAETHRSEDALRQLNSAAALEPCSAVTASIGLVNWMAGRYKEAIDYSRQALRADGHCVRALWTIGLAYEAMEQFPPALRWIHKALDISHGSPSMRASVAHICARAGRVHEAREQIAAMEEQAKSQYVSAGEMALPYVALRDFDRAFEWLFRATEEHSVCLVLTNVDPRLKPLRNDPRFQQLLQKIGFRAARPASA